MESLIYRGKIPISEESAGPNKEVLLSKLSHECMCSSVLHPVQTTNHVAELTTNACPGGPGGPLPPGCPG